MTTHTNHHCPSAAEGLHTYGLAGIDLQRAAERRAVKASQHGSADRQPGLVHWMRQMAGDAIIRLGTGIAGKQARQAAPAIRAKVDMA